MNWTTQGADPNPLVSGALFAPIGAGLVRSGRGMSALSRAYAGEPTFAGDTGNAVLLENQLTNPYTQAALAGSLAGMIGGAGTSIYNTVAGGDDIDNNLVAGGLALLGGLAPITYSMVRGRGNTMASEPIGTSRKPVNPKTGYYEDAVEGVTAQTTSQPRYSRNPSRIDLATGTYSRNPSRIIL